MAGDDIRVVGDWRGERTGTSHLIRLSVCLSIPRSLSCWPGQYYRETRALNLSNGWRQEQKS